MTTEKRRKTWVSVTEALRQRIAESGSSFIELERQTGVTRQSMMKFLREEQSLRLDKADVLMCYFDLRVIERE